ncbi:uncharacterized protein Z518_02574 [Rhinocladiella mackenziei CBS 650.93]|uniref:Choline kinase N-terminal domain-containing protein n=1 Tax=Rhinocladiella mackenziei CBS 650.93 TaxID=1442369 RepID=A0A0D2JFB0_9EURO|nr:uncharacterized protein Z518_02574 [Rhinocladiella mackenziei CBS 650.93]KIX07920.1 hypothetical protein Z518_02574 [Rhinocladiella mackenziei CBS 650.93]
MTGRPALPHSNSLTSTTNPMSYLSLDNNPESGETTSESKTPNLQAMLSQVVEWLQDEKTKQQRRRHRRHRHHPHHAPIPVEQSDESSSKAYDSAVENEPDLSLEKLENILSGFTSSPLQSLHRLAHKSSTSLSRKGSIAKKYKRGSIVPQSSDTEFFGDEILVPNVEAYLDNSKTMAFTGGSADTDTSDSAKRRDYEHWVTFKKDIVRLTHTLKLKGWRRIPIDRASDIDVARLSGALTNAVYVVRPPQDMSKYDNFHAGTDSSAPPVPVSKRRPMQLLLRIYGPQAEHLIDRDSELGILRRLARKRIGPRLLGSFENGRFEEFLHAKTLTADDLRVPETSKQIAKRMRELHDGMELLESELAAGPAVFINWDKWVDRCEKVVTWLDEQVHQAETESKGDNARRAPPVNPRYIRRGLICGVEWPIFRRAYEAYRQRLIGQYGGMKGLRQKLIFAHNDTQYGNLMRLQPSGESPLLQPSNQHKQLVVIDFEYASQNTVGLEFANHFTEWCYNYHHPELSFACDTRRYPSQSEQYRFVRSYVMHRPQYNPAASATPKMEGREKTNISDFMLDARAPGGGSQTGSGFVNPWGDGIDYDKEEREREKKQEEQIQELLSETRLWRLANSAQWVAWGIMQAKVPELDELEKRERAAANKKSGAGTLVEKVQDIVGANKTQKNQPLHPMSDPLTEEEKVIQEQSRRDGPEGQRQEEVHHKDDEGAQTEEKDPACAHPSVNGHGTDHDDNLVNGDGSGNAEMKHAQANASEDVKDADKATDNESAEIVGEDEFDYLAYAHDRAMFFWGDCLTMGIVKEDELPENLMKRVKIVPF